MEIIRKPLGLYKTNCYIVKDYMVHCQEDMCYREEVCVVIDPGHHGHQIIDLIGTARPLAILITHGHADHICAVDTLVDHYGIPVYMNRKDDELLRVKRRMPSSYKERFIAPYHHLGEGELELGPFHLVIRETPGHSAGSVLIQIGDDLFTGDTLFKGTIGKYTTFNGSEEDLYHSMERIITLDPNLRIHPGHAEGSTMGEEVQHNQKLRDIIIKFSGSDVC